MVGNEKDTLTLLLPIFTLCKVLNVSAEPVRGGAVTANKGCCELVT